MTILRFIQDSFSADFNPVSWSPVTWGQLPMATQVRPIDDRYVIGLVRREFHPDLPSNFAVEMRRFYALKRKFARDPKFATRYTAVMEEYIRLGPARKATAEGTVRHGLGSS